ncbi:hypothetical protein [Campylobacter pinnipediorum]|uniref:hypothetical protein n=1 Tax=Campylobacter pinnipediorum TaxID=1965231 RepID=UPI0018E9D3ED|nr:hypothetical protein [Campylobacter pinnipediorum]
MKDYGYEIKEGKHIAFREKNQKRFTRAKSIDENYTEEKIKERIQDKLLGNAELENIINVKDKRISEKMSGNKVYGDKITYENMRIMSKTLIEIRNLGIKDFGSLDKELSKIKTELSEKREKLSLLDTEYSRRKDVMADFENLIAKKSHYDGYKKNPKDKIYMIMNGKDVEKYQASHEVVDMFLRQFPHLKDFINIDKIDKKTMKKINTYYENLCKKQNKMVDEYNQLVDRYEKLEKIKNNVDAYLYRGQNSVKKQSWIESVMNKSKEDENREREKNQRKNHETKWNYRRRKCIVVRI